MADARAGEAASLAARIAAGDLAARLAAGDHMINRIILSNIGDASRAAAQVHFTSGLSGNDALFELKNGNDALLELKNCAPSAAPAVALAEAAADPSFLAYFL